MGGCGFAAVARDGRQTDVVVQPRRFAIAPFGHHLTGGERYARLVTEGFAEHEDPGFGATDSFGSLA